MDKQTNLINRISNNHPNQSLHGMSKLVSILLTLSFTILVVSSQRLQRDVQTGTLSPLDVERTINQMFSERHDTVWKHTLDTTLNSDHIEQMNRSAIYDHFNLFYKAYKTSLENWLKEYLANELKFKLLAEQRPMMTDAEYEKFKFQMDMCVETCRATLWKMLHEIYAYIDLNLDHFVSLYRDRFESTEIIQYDQLQHFVERLGTLVQKQIAKR